MCVNRARTSVTRSTAQLDDHGAGRLNNAAIHAGGSRRYVTGDSVTAKS